MNSMTQKPSFRLITCLVLFTFILSSLIPHPSFAQTLLNLPVPGVMVAPTPAYVPPILKGMKIFPDNPLRFDFIVDTGDSTIQGEELKKESEKLIRYFLASLTTPEKDLWVNLSPYEKDRIIPDKFGTTEMGRDLLAQDYILKQLTASLIYPEEGLGKEFWDRVYKKANELYGTTNIPINTFNKVWIVPAKAVVYETKDTAFVVESHLKVMLEGDYLALQNNLNKKEIGTDKLPDTQVKELSDASSQIVKDVILPGIEKEINEGQNFASLRQIYHSLILSVWYKKRLKDSILGRVYVDKNKVAGVDVEDKEVRQKIYNQYLEAFKKGVYDYIKQDEDVYLNKTVQRRYVSGGVDWADVEEVVGQNINFVDTPPEETAVKNVLTTSETVIQMKLNPINTAHVEKTPTSPRKRSIDYEKEIPSLTNIPVIEVSADVREEILKAVREKGESPGYLFPGAYRQYTERHPMTYYFDERNLKICGGREYTDHHRWCNCLFGMLQLEFYTLPEDFSRVQDCSNIIIFI